MPSLVIQTSFLGDMVLTTPLLAALAARGEVDVVATAAGAQLLANHPAVRRVHVFDKRGRDAGLGGLRRVARTLRHERYEAAYLAQGSTRSGALGWAARIPRRVGFDSSSGRRFYTERVPYIDNAHHAERLLALASPGAAAELVGSRPRPSLYPGALEREAVDALLRRWPWGGGRFVALAPGSVWPTKRWPGYAALAAELSELPLVIVGGAADRGIAGEIVAAAGDRALDATGALPLLASAELVGRAAVLVTNDSAPLHLASAMGTPVVSVFGPTVPELGFGPLGDRATVIGHTGLACRPCDRHGPVRCPLGHWRCMREITATQVAAAIRTTLSST